MNFLRLAAPAAFGLAMMGGVHAMPATSGAGPSVENGLIQHAQQYYRERAPRLDYGDRRRFRGDGYYGRPRVVCRVVPQRIINERTGRVRIVQREVCRRRW